MSLLTSSGYSVHNEETVAFNVMWDNTNVLGFKERITLLRGNKIEIPFGSIATDEVLKKIYRESVLSYLYGLPDASIPMSLRFLQLVSRKEFRRIKNQPTATPKLEVLINWTETQLHEPTTAHGFQILRNFIHTEQTVKDQDALEAIRHVSIITNKIHGFDVATVYVRCDHCGLLHIDTIPSQDYILGLERQVRCIDNGAYYTTYRINI